MHPKLKLQEVLDGAVQGIVDAQDRLDDQWLKVAEDGRASGSLARHAAAGRELSAGALALWHALAPPRQLVDRVEVEVATAVERSREAGGRVGISWTVLPLLALEARHRYEDSHASRLRLTLEVTPLRVDEIEGKDAFSPPA